MDMTEHLAGPWQAVLADTYGWVYDSVEDAIEEDDADYDEYEILIVRGAATPTRPRGAERARLPMIWNSGDMAYREDDFQLVEPHEPANSAAVVYARARAMAAGLNAAVPA